MSGYLKGILSHGQRAALGLLGQEYINDTQEHEGDWLAFIPIEDTVFTQLDQPLRSGSNSPLSPEIHPAGVAIPGPINLIQLESGAGWAIEAPPKSAIE